MKYSLLPYALSLILFFSCCTKMDETVDEVLIETPDWTESTHGTSVEPDYLTVFPQDKVQRFDIVISGTDWTAIQKNLSTMPRLIPGASVDNSFSPIWVPCSFYYSGKQWYKAGIRVKGNSSLNATFSSGIKKFSFKIDFDRYEDTFPSLKNQRFFGFKQLNLNNNFDDKSEIREKVAGDLFREFGIPCAKSAFYELYIDFGGGSQYFGLYTLVEEVDNTVIETQFTSKAGNLYKPEGPGASLAKGSFNKSDLYKKTNEGLADYSDIEALYETLNSELRTSDPVAWRAKLNSMLNLDLFLRWLAANTVMQNWDTYGKMSHNYYLYNDPADSRFVWIPWDNNEALQAGKMGGAINLNLNGVSSQWPLINYIASDDSFFTRYKELVKVFANTVFDPLKMQTAYDNYYNLIYESVIKEEQGFTFLKNGNSEFTSAINELKQHVVRRNSQAIMLP